MKILESYNWPGNVRELENVIERALALSTDEVITGEDIPAQLSEERSRSTSEIALPADGLNLEAYLDDIRLRLMSDALERAGGVQTQAAEIIGMSFRSFRYYAKKMGLTKDADDEASVE